MIRLLLLIGTVFYLSVYVIYPRVQFDTTPPTVNLLAKQIEKKYILNINESNIIKIQDDTELKSVRVSISNKDTKNKFVKVWYDNIKGKEHTLNLNKTILKSILSGYITSLKIKVTVTDNSFSDNTTEKTFDVKIDNKKPLIKVINKSLYSLSKGSLISLKLKALDNESDIDKITINGNKNYTILEKNKNHYNLLIPVDDSIIKTRMVNIEVFDTVGNKSVLKTYFLTKDKNKTHTVDIGQNSIQNLIETMKITLENKNINIPALYKEDIDTIDNIIGRIAKEKKMKNLKTVTLSSIETPIYKNDKRNVIDFGDSILFGKTKLETSGEFYLANKYQKIINPLDGHIVFIGKLNVLGNTIIIKNNNGLYTTFGLLKTIDEGLAVGENIKKGVHIGLPDYSALFESNFYFSININNTYIKPHYFFDSDFYKTNLLKVFNKDRK